MRERERKKKQTDAALFRAVPRLRGKIMNRYHIPISRFYIVYWYTKSFSTKVLHEYVKHSHINVLSTRSLDGYYF
jgi:hypothetical protein